MTELALRGGFNDHRAIEELLNDPLSLPPRSARHIRRLVVDSTAVVHTRQFAQTARDTGTQLLIDPQTSFLTSQQPVDDSWARLPFAQAEALDVHLLRDPAVRGHLIDEVVRFQVGHGATAVIPPYLHLEDDSGVAADVQRQLIKETVSYLHANLGADFNIFPIVSIDRRAVLLDANLWQAGLGRLLRMAAKAADGQPFGLALSATTRPSATALYKNSRIWRRASGIGPFVAWHAGDVGLLATAMGARGYESGMCAGERCNVHSQQRNRAPGSNGPGPRYNGVYVDSIGHSLARSAVETLSHARGTVQGDLGCMNPQCCPSGFATLLGPGRRQHAARSRIAELQALDSISARRWRLHHIRARAANAAKSAARIRKAADQQGITVGAYVNEHLAMEKVATGLQETARMAIA